MQLRDKHIDRLATEEFDALIVGAGINGAVSAAALAAHGVRVGLIDTRDFAGFTSQHSSNLVWGGIKYMESYDFCLVNDLCTSRNKLMRAFPSTVKEIRFLITIAKDFRVRPLTIYAGTWLYWLFGRGKTPIPRLLSSAQIRRMEPLVNVSDSRGGVEYSDAYLQDNDTRFVFNFVRNAMDKGCVAANYVRSNSAQRKGNNWMCEAEDVLSGKKFSICARVLINAAGAFVDSFNDQCGVCTRHQHLFSKGVHLIVPQLSRNTRVLAFFADDGRLFFAIPMAHRTCIGTTDTVVENPVTKVTDEDREFILSNINARLNLAKPLGREDIIAERCGVRPLAIAKGEGDLMQLSRKHIVEVDKGARHISIFGGKLTDCLNVGNEVSKLVRDLGVPLRKLQARWYGEPDAQTARAYFARARQLGLDAITAKDTGESVSNRLWRRYSNHAMSMLDAIEQDATLAEPLLDGAGICRCEIAHLAASEMIATLEDFLRRRSKIELLVSRQALRSSRGLVEACEQFFGAAAQDKLEEYFAKEKK